MPSFAIFEMSTDHDKKSVTFTALIHPMWRDSIVTIVAEDMNEAVSEAGSFLRMLKVNLHRELGAHHPDLVKSSIYYLGQPRIDEGVHIDSRDIVFRIHEFVPVPFE